MQPLRVYFLASALGACGSARQLALVARGLPRERFHVEVGVIGAIGEAATPLGEELEAAGIRVQPLPIRNALDFRGMSRLRRAVEASRPAILHAWGPAAVRATRTLPAAIPRIASAASHGFHGLAGWLTARQLRRCQRVVAATRAEGERLRRLGVASSHLSRIAPGVPLPIADPSMDRLAALKELGLPPDARFIVAAGRCEPNSGLKSAIWAFDMLRYDHPEIHLVILGEGPERESLEGFAHALMFDDPRVHFVGARFDCPALLHHADIVWVTHERGGTSLALEGMAAGKPVIGWNTGDLAEIIDDEATGHLAPLNERPRLSGKTYPLLKDAERRQELGQAGRRRVEEHFSASRAVEHFARLYSELALPTIT